MEGEWSLGKLTVAFIGAYVLAKVMSSGDLQKAEEKHQNLDTSKSLETTAMRFTDELYKDPRSFATREAFSMKPEKWVPKQVQLKWQEYADALKRTQTRETQDTEYMAAKKRQQQREAEYAQRSMESFRQNQKKAGSGSDITGGKKG